MKDELVVGLEANDARKYHMLLIMHVYSIHLNLRMGKLGITKSFTSEASGLMIELTFVITSIPQEETIGEDVIDIELSQMGMLKLRLRESTMFKYMQLRSRGIWESS